MAIYGENVITMSDGGLMKIMDWSIRRTQKLTEGQTTYTYECTFDWLPLGASEIQSLAFDLTHDYKDGGVELMAKFFIHAQGMIEETENA